MKILFLGDIVGRPGRKVVEKILPEVLKKYKPDFVLANAENLAGGKGITAKTIKEMQKSGIDFFTGGNHIFKNPEGFEYLEKEDAPVVVPCNFYPEAPGKRWSIMTAKNGKRLLVVSVLGQTFMSQQVENPFSTLEEMIKCIPKDDYDVSLVDVHAEATSEKYALRWLLDGKISVMVGTHTHVPTADADISPLGTAFQADVGMNGSLDSCIGIKSKLIIKKLKTQLPVATDLEKKGRMQFNAVLINCNSKGIASSIKPIRKILDTL